MTSPSHSAFVLPSSSHASAFTGRVARATPFAGRTCLPNAARSQARTAARSVAVSMSGGSVLIVNAKGGGHGHIGLHLAEKLLSDGHAVHIHQLGNETSSNPIKQYPALQAKYGADRFSVEYGPVPASYPSATAAGGYTAVFDNNAKSADDVNPAIAAAKASGAQMFYVSSAGAYKYDANVAPHEVSNAASGPTIDVEDTIKAAGVCSANFRPIYIIGPHTSKREYIDFFFDRLVRNRPIPLPGTGDELTSISDVRDIATLLASAVGKDLSNQTINCVNTRGITFNAMVKFCADACGAEPNIVYYDPKKMESAIDGFKVKAAFPFRPRHFFADPIQAQTLLGWKPTVAGTSEGLAASVKECYDEYVQLGLDKADVDFSLDDKILASL